MLASKGGIVLLVLASTLMCGDAFRKKQMGARKKVAHVEAQAESPSAMVETKDSSRQGWFWDDVVEAVADPVRATWPFDGWEASVETISSNSNNIANLGSNVGSNAGNIASNANQLSGLTGQVSGNAGQIANLGSQVTGNAGQIASTANDIANVGSQVTSNAGHIANVGSHAATNAADIAANAQNIAGLSGQVSSNAGHIANVGSQVTSNAGQLASNAQNIAGLSGQVSSNAGHIANLGSSAVTNAGDIAANAQNIAGLSGQVSNSAGHIANVGSQAAANAGDIASNAQNLAGLSGQVSSNAGAIGNLGAHTASNAGNIATNAQNIAGLSGQAASNADMISKVGSHAAANSQNVFTNAQNIAGISGQAANNANNIAAVGSHAAANTGMIASNAANIGTLGGHVASNAGHIATNANNIEAVGNFALSNAAGVGANSQAILGLSGQAAQNSAQIAGLVSSVGMLSGTVAANSANIATLGAQVAVLGEVAAPTIALANALGVSINTVATISLAGSFAAPVLGCIMLVYVCWPDERNDPWWKMEERVSQMINDRFNKERRVRLTNRLKRYVHEFARCSTAWIENQMQPALTNNVQFTDNSLAQISSVKEVSSFMKSAMRDVSGGEIVENVVPSLFEATSYTSAGSGVPGCMEQLEMHMSLERDEWMSTQGNSLDGLFMPFANMHTQVQALLADYDTEVKKTWKIASQNTAATYAAFILQHIMDGWKGQVCRSVRLRYSRSAVIYWKYALVALTPIWQPNAGETCWEKCGEKSGWCSFCGGTGVGACCSAGAAFESPPKDPSECRQFDIPVSGWRKQPYHTCVHTDCQQSNSDYTGTVMATNEDLTDWSECQEYCRSFSHNKAVFNEPPKRIVFTMQNYGSGTYCTCKTGALTRFYSSGVTSGPIECGDSEPHGAAQSEEDTEHVHSVPMTENSPCGRSPRVSNLEDLETTHADWVQNCYANVSRVVLDEFNPFFKRFVKFVDRLAWKAGCGEHPDLAATEDFNAVESGSNAGSFAQCDWDKERKHGDDAEWTPDPVRERGFFGTNRIDVDEQAKMQTRYPLPTWLARRQNMLACLQQVASGGDLDDPQFGSELSGISEAVAENTHQPGR